MPNNLVTAAYDPRHPQLCLPQPDHDSLTYHIALRYISERLLTYHGVGAVPQELRQALRSSEARLSDTFQAEVKAAVSRMRTLTSRYEPQFTQIYDTHLRGVLARVENDSDAASIFLATANEIFTDANGMNWGRVVALFCFAAFLSSECLRSGHNNVVCHIPDLITSYTQLQHFTLFLQRNQGWSGLHEHFDQQSSLLSMDWCWWLKVTATLTLIGSVAFISWKRLKD